MKINLNNINGSAIAKKASVSAGYLSKILNGRKPLSSLRTFYRVARALGVSMDELFKAVEDRCKDNANRQKK